MEGENTDEEDDPDEDELESTGVALGMKMIMPHVYSVVVADLIEPFSRYPLILAGIPLYSQTCHNYLPSTQCISLFTPDPALWTLSV